MQSTEQYFPVEMLISVNKVNLTWESVNEKPAARQVLSPRTFFRKVFQEIQFGVVPVINIRHPRERKVV